MGQNYCKGNGVLTVLCLDLNRHLIRFPQIHSVFLSPWEQWFIYLAGIQEEYTSDKLNEGAI